jgi:hypothetical protein
MKSLKGLTTLTSLVAAVALLGNTGERPKPIVKKPADLVWVHQPSGVEVAVLQGDPSRRGPFTLRLRYPAGYRKAPHYHPKDAFVTVLSGGYFRGYGNRFDEASGIELTPGTFSMNPGKVSHYEWTTMPAELQVHATGPWGSVYVDEEGQPLETAK